MSDYILAIDQGTTSSRAILFNREGHSVHSAQEEFPQYFPNDGWIEHEPADIWQTVERSFQQVIANVDTSNDVVRAIGITNQRETTLIWDRKTGQPLYRAIVWQDRRTSEYCQQLKNENLESLISEKTGLLIDPYFSATKIRWILDNVDGARARAEKGELAFGTVDSYILWKLTGGKEHRTDATNASRTMLFNIHTQQWDEDLLNLFNIPRALLPEVMDSSDNFGVTDKETMGVEIPILGMAGDQQAALFGQTCFREGMAKSTYGTGCFMIVNTGDIALKSENRLLSTVAYRINGKVTYALEGSIFIAGATVQWLRDGLKLINDAGDTEPLARQTPIDHGVYLVPAFTGLGAPYWDPNARGAIFGLTRDTGIKEIVTAGLQSVCYQTKDLQKAMESDGERPIALRVDGGMVANNWVMQFLADILGATVDRPQITETTALGVAYLAGLKAEIYNSLEELEGMWQREKCFEPEFDKPTRDSLYDGWKNAVRRVQS
ncbi:glycerol kinase GlpK [Pseudoalteromonas sp. S554]|uniref:glycerol kinase GlpK n=1 Tax=Pseudoalteromonas sp. S554 TaxID=2066516 RepID=UPI00110CCB28|nr:glycerol kinase GlpK [Pseudoalteromonas sp. S554]TMS80553.1 glycerol kinase [Pseudoalteromonas sp. S554]